MNKLKDYQYHYIYARLKTLLTEMTPYRFYIINDSLYGMGAVRGWMDCCIEKKEHNWSVIMKVSNEIWKQVIFDKNLRK